jgi:hypothetical protein
LQIDEDFDFRAHVRQFALQHGLYLRTSVLLLPQRQQQLDLVQGEAQLPRTADKREVTNLPVIEETVSAGAAGRGLNEPMGTVSAMR